MLYRCPKQISGTQMQQGKEMKEKIFTDQIATIHKYANYDNETVPCYVCKKIIGLRDALLDNATGLAWFDPYAGKKNKSGKKAGKYVCHECLSLERACEIEISKGQA